MSAVALIMAGGRGERMRLSGIDLPKPLVPVLGRTLLERNVRSAQRAGITDIVVSVGEQDHEVRAAVLELSARPLVETEPLGNIGAAAALRGSAPVLVLYADNLTTLDLREILGFHEGSGAALTLAAHDEPFRLPYGRLTLAGERVTAYDEKPVIDVTVCSAVAVLGEGALAALQGPMGLVDLTRALLRAGELVVAFAHQAPWVDVNDAAGVARAEELVDRHGEAFA